MSTSVCSIFLTLYGCFAIASACFGSGEAQTMLTLEAAIERTLQANLDLQVSREEVEAQHALVDQAHRSPNPELEIATENAGMNEFEITVQQVIEWRGKRSARINQANMDELLLKTAYDKLYREKVAEASEKFLEVMESQQKHFLLHDALAVSENIVASVTQRVEAGAILGVEITRAELAHSRLKRQHDREQSTFKAKKEILAALWNGTSTDIDQVAIISESPTMPQLSTLIDHVENNFELRHLRKEAEKQRLVIAAARASRMPNLSIGAGFLRKSEENENAALLNFSLELPFLDRNQGNIKYAEAKLKVIQLTETAARKRIVSHVRALYYHMEASFQDMANIEERILPGAEKAYQEIEQLYAKGKVSFLDLLDSRQTVIEVHFLSIETRISFRKSEIWLMNLLNMPE